MIKYSLVEQLREALKSADNHFIGLYNGIAPAGRYDGGNRFADTDTVIVEIRKVLDNDQ